MTLAAFAPQRPPCSAAERAAAEAVAGEFARLGHRPALSSLRAPTSPTWAPMLRAVLRVWAAALLAADLSAGAGALAALAAAGSIPALAALLRAVPLLGGTTQNVVAYLRGTENDARPIAVVAHVDSHPTNGAPLTRWHRLVANLSGWLLLVAAFTGRPPGWRAFAGPVAAEAILTLAWLARSELARSDAPPDDNTSGLMALVHLAELARESHPSRDLWIVAAGAATSGSRGMTTFLAEHPELARAWIVEIDALGSGEVVASPSPPRFPFPGTPSALVRGVVAAARVTGDPLDVRRVRRPHSDARAALRRRVAAITLTAGIRHPARQGPDAANAARAARVAHELARLAG